MTQSSLNIQSTKGDQKVLKSLEQFCSSKNLSVDPFKDLFKNSTVHHVPNCCVEEAPHSLVATTENSHTQGVKREATAFPKSFTKEGKRPKKDHLNMKVKVKLTLEESIRGGPRNIEYDYAFPCVNCNGKVLMPPPPRNASLSTLLLPSPEPPDPTALSSYTEPTPSMPPCTSCNSRRVTYSRKSTEIDIPLGVSKGFQKVIEGEGKLAEDYVTRGDLIIEFDVDDHPHLKREGDCAFITVTVSVYQAILGTKIMVPKLYGLPTDLLDVTVPPGTQPNTKIHIPREGYTKANCKKKRGDLVITVVVQLPTSLSTEQKELFERLAVLDSMLQLSNMDNHKL